MIYLDNQASTPCDPDVVDAMLPFFTEVYANPGSLLHEAGKASAGAVQDARAKIADLIGAVASEVIFTSGATESNNIAILGLSNSIGSERTRIVTTAVEHKAVLAPCRELERQGFDVVVLPVDEKGTVDIDAAESAITEDTLLVSVQAANNEIGTIQPVAEVARLARNKGAIMHCDAAQAVGKIPVDVEAWDVDLLSISAHKLYGPKGVGAFYVRGGPYALPISPLLIGGGQEKGMRSGTLNVPGIVGFGEACRLCEQQMTEESARIAALRDRLEEAVMEASPGVRRNGALGNRLPGSSSLTFPGIDAEALVLNTPQLAISTGSACTSGAPEPSHVLLAIGLEREEASGTVRIAVGRFNSEDEIDRTANIIAGAIERLSHSRVARGYRIWTPGEEGGSMEGKPALSRYCVYTIRHTADLDNVYENEGGSGEFAENRKWVQGEELFREAERNGEKMPILFAPAEKDGGLVYRAILTSVEVAGSDPEKGMTRYVFTDLAKLKQEPPKSSLVKKSNNKPLSDDYIRPYVVCHTPSFA